MCNSAYKIADCPSIHADAKITRWFTNFCIKYFADNFDVPVVKIYLIGSRVTGVSSKGGLIRPNSDYDFYVVVSDVASKEAATGSALWQTFLDAVRNARTQVNIQRTIEVLISRECNFKQSSSDAISHAAMASREGFVIAERRMP